MKQEKKQEATTGQANSMQPTSGCSDSCSCSPQAQPRIAINTCAGGCGSSCGTGVYEPSPLEKLLNALPPNVLRFLMQRSRDIVAGFIIIIAGIAILFGFRSYMENKEHDAAFRLSKIEQMTEIDKRIESLEKFSQTDASTDAGKQALLILAQDYLEKNNNAKAAEIFLKIKNQFSNTPYLKASATLNLGIIAQKEAKLDEAENHFKEAAKEKALEATAKQYLGFLYVKQGKNDEAKKALEQYLALKPNATDKAYIKNIIVNL